MTLTMTKDSSANDQTNSVHSSFASGAFANARDSTVLIRNAFQSRQAIVKAPSFRDMVDDNSSRSLQTENCSIHIADASVDLNASPSLVRSISTPSISSWYSSENDNTLDMGMYRRSSAVAKPALNFEAATNGGK